MYPNLNAEIARKGIVRKEIAEGLGISPSTLSLKLNGKAIVTLREAATIKRILNVNMPIEELFSTQTCREEAS